MFPPGQNPIGGPRKHNYKYTTSTARQAAPLPPNRDDTPNYVCDVSSENVFPPSPRQKPNFPACYLGGGVCKASANKISSVAASIIDRCSCFMYPVRTRPVSLTSPLVSTTALTHGGIDVQKALNSHTSPLPPPPPSTQTVAHQKKEHHPTDPSVSGGITLRFSCCCRVAKPPVTDRAVVATPFAHGNIHQPLRLCRSDGASLSL